jgi:hypothetical protein
MSKWFCGLFPLLMLFYNATSAQADKKLLHYLAVNKLWQEEAAYLHELPSKVPDDSLHYFWAKYYLQTGADSFFLSAYEKSKNLFLDDTGSSNLANIHFLVRPAGVRQKWFTSYDEKKGTPLSQSIRMVYDASERPLEANPQLLPDKLEDDFLQFRKSFHHKAWIAATLSAAVPGLGKLYAGRKASAGMTFILNSAYALQAYESYAKLGPRNAFTIYSIGLFGLFYTVNVYGSWHAVKEVRKERKTQFLIHAEEYYRFHYPNSLYF